MSKKFKGKTCVYCGIEGSYSTGNHVFARGFFPKNQRVELPQVPSCESCNNAKSKLEHYLTAILPFGNQLSGSIEMLETMAQPRLAANQKLHHQLSNEMSQSQVEKGGVILDQLQPTLDFTKISAYFEYVVRGLLWHHWEIQRPAHYFVWVGVLESAREGRFIDLLTQKSERRVEKTIGNEIFRYVGTHDCNDCQFSVWWFSIFGGVMLTGDPLAPNEISSRIWVITSRQPIHN